MKSNFKKLTWVFLLFTFSINGCAKSDSGEYKSGGENLSVQERIRPAAKACTWYPNNPEKLREQITAFLDKAESAGIEGRVIGLVAPHAGYSFSGLTAAHAYKQVADKKYETIIIMAPNHGYEGGFSGVSVYSGDGYRTPLGIARVDKKLKKKYEDLKEYVKQQPADAFSQFIHGKQSWNYLEFGNRLKSWSKFRRCIFTTLETEEEGQMQFEFVQTDVFILWLSLIFSTNPINGM